MKVVGSFHLELVHSLAGLRDIDAVRLLRHIISPSPFSSGDNAKPLHAVVVWNFCIFSSLGRTVVFSAAPISFAKPLQICSGKYANSWL